MIRWLTILIAFMLITLISTDLSAKRRVSSKRSYKKAPSRRSRRVSSKKRYAKKRPASKRTSKKIASRSGSSSRVASRKPAAISRGASMGGSHVDFDDLNIEGQNKKSSAFYFLERLNKDDSSRVKERKHFRTEILESI